jgi:hypothetical protein
LVAALAWPLLATTKPPPILGPNGKPANPAQDTSKPGELLGPNGKPYYPAPTPLPSIDKVATPIKDAILAGLGKGITALVSAHGLEIAKAALVDSDSSSAKLLEGANINVDVGDVYKIEAVLDYSSWTAPLAHNAGSYDDYMYALYINGEKKFEEQVGRAPSPKKSFHPKDWNPAGNLTTKIAVYVLATNLPGNNCNGTVKDVVAIRTWVRSGRVTASMSPESIKKLVKETGANWQEGDTPPAAASVTVITHNPWLVQMDQYPKGSLDHHAADASGQAAFRLLQNRSFPGDHPADPPKELEINVSLWSTGNDGHFRFGPRKPEEFRQGLITNSTVLSFTQPYQQIGYKTHHDPHANASVPLIIGGLAWGRRAPLPDGPSYEWQVKPKSIPGSCLNYEWKLQDIDEGNQVAEIADGPTESPEDFDACLVGTWLSDSVSVLERPAGGAGIVMKIKGDGRETLDYNGMKALAGSAGESNTWTGTCSGVIRASHGRAELVRVDNSDLKHTYFDPNGKATTNELSGLGPAALGPNQPPDYTCDQQTLTFKHTAHTLVYKRQAD